MDGKCDCIKNSSLSAPGFVDVPSFIFFYYSKGIALFFSLSSLSMFIDSVEFCSVLKSFQSCFFGPKAVFFVGPQFIS